jgi:hypothetical protein
LSSIKWLEASDALLSSTTLIRNKETIVSNQKMTAFLSKNKITMNSASLVFTTVPLFDQTVAAAQGLLPGANIISWGAKTHATSACRSRNVLITEDDNNNIIFLTTKS